MPNQWTRQNQKDFDAQEMEHEEYNDIGLDASCEVVSINKFNDEEAIFTARDIILAMTGFHWVDLSKLLSALNSMGVNNAMEITKDTLTAILKEMEEEELISVYWDTERIARNF